MAGKRKVAAVALISAATLGENNAAAAMTKICPYQRKAIFVLARALSLRHSCSHRGRPRWLSPFFQRRLRAAMRSSRGGWVMKRRLRPEATPPEIPKAAI